MPRVRTTGHGAKGFSLLETLIAIAVLLIGVLGAAELLGESLLTMRYSEYDFIAQEKAQQAAEAIFTAKYTNESTWAQISNFSAGNPGGLFLSGPQPLLQPGATDGLFGTVNDEAMPPDYILMPGPSGKLGTADDVQIPLSNFTRTITITNVLNSPNLRQIQVMVSYGIANTTRSYTLTTFISAFN
jgi:prepilin-type N-terminal cleavage/methylation domain-containing protein